jgi:XTP/dITP diphosphohydrolase
MRILLASRNPKKLAELRRILDPALPDVDVIGLDDVPPYDEVPESGATFADNALIKAREGFRHTGLPTVADDSGLEVLALGGAPGVRSKRFAGADGDPEAVDAANNAELLRRLRGASEPRRRARYRCVLVFLRDPSAVPEVFEGVAGGRILETPRGTGGFGYDPLFHSDELGKSFGEATPEEKDAVSHRGRALRALAAALGPAPATGRPPAAT